MKTCPYCKKRRIDQIVRKRGRPNTKTCGHPDCKRKHINKISLAKYHTLSRAERKVRNRKIGVWKFQPPEAPQVKRIIPHAILLQRMGGRDFIRAANEILRRG